MVSGLDTAEMTRWSTDGGAVEGGAINSSTAGHKPLITGLRVALRRAHFIDFAHASYQSLDLQRPIHHRDEYSLTETLIETNFNSTEDGRSNTTHNVAVSRAVPA